ncbi:hypothetical protein IV203_009989 [Nitzschia inconspicua]|uniref:Uncharacterized protein n=1 Tax=Nitzschia inconspicua TaxID=303405 RepID=A0A9K3KVA0_9STRA|nr:hypothetical protein IV203_009989 [Nitzschia inconspicua]
MNDPAKKELRSPAHTSTLYKRAIVHAIHELHDSNLRSNIDSIRRHVQSTLETDQGTKSRYHTPWNETIFLKTLKSLVQDGDVEQCTSLNCGLSPEFKRRVSEKAQAIKLPQCPSLTGMSYPIFEHHYEPQEKNLPAKKLEHYKLKICPKKWYDLQHVPVKNPMDTF